MFRTHVLFGILVWLILERLLEMPFFVLGFVMLGSVFVDVDSCSSKIGKRLWFLSWCFKHRGVLHSLLACLVLSLVVGAFSLWAGFGFFVGYFSHLFLDSFTKMGIKLFWPFVFRVTGGVGSGGWVEDVLFVLFLFGDVLLVVYKLL